MTARCIALAAVIAAAACGSAPDPRGSLAHAASEETAVTAPKPGRYECLFRFLRLEGTLEPDSLGSRHIQATTDRLYGKRPVSHASEICEIVHDLGGSRYLIVPNQPRIPIKPISEQAFLLLWHDRAEFRRIEDNAFQGEVRTAAGIETVTLYYIGPPRGSS